MTIHTTTTTTPHSTINIDHKENKAPVYTSEDPMMPKPPKELLMKLSQEKNNTTNRERIIITKEK